MLFRSEIAKLSNDELRAKTVELKKYISDSAAEEQKNRGCFSEFSHICNGVLSGFLGIRVYLNVKPDMAVAA